MSIVFFISNMLVGREIDYTCLGKFGNPWIRVMLAALTVPSIMCLITHYNPS